MHQVFFFAKKKKYCIFDIKKMELNSEKEEMQDEEMENIRIFFSIWRNYIWNLWLIFNNSGRIKYKKITATGLFAKPDRRIWLNRVSEEISYIYEIDGKKTLV